MRAVKHYGMGYDGTAWLIEYLTNPKSRRFDLQAVVIAQTGNESVLIKKQMERYIFPLLAQQEIRTVQIARATSSLRDGYVVLSDTRSPTTCYIRPTTQKPYWSLGEEMLISATVPQYSSNSRFCSEKFKISILERWHECECPGCTKLIGFNADESNRVKKAVQIHGLHEQRFPLHEQGLCRVYIESFVRDFVGTKFQVTPEFYLSACTFCPFSQISGGGESLQQRWILQPYEAARAAYLEYVSLCFNPKQSLSLGHKSVIQRHLLSQEAKELFELELSEAIWRLYRVRRIRGGRVPYRSIKPIFSGNRTACETQLKIEAAQYNVELRYCQHGIARVIIPVFGEDCEEFLVAAPGDPKAKERKSFQSIWNQKQSPYQQLELFDLQ
jgi:hypothetical protein